MLSITKTYEAIRYALNHWVKLCRYVYYSDACIDNNAAERAVRPTKLGMKNCRLPTEDLFKSLGFNLELQAEESDEGFRAVHDDKDYLSNLEYDEEDASGHVQYIVAGRYLMGIQIENLSFETFQIMEDSDGLMGGMLEAARTSN